MLTRPGRPRAWLPGGSLPRPLAAVLALLTVAAAVMLPAAPAWADHVRDQELWVLDAVHAPGAWQVTQGRGVTVAVIDSGVSPAVSDLAGSVRTGPDLTGVRTPESNPNWGVHGTWMATLIAGHGHGPGGTSGIVGVAPQARILSIRVVTDSGDPGYRAYQRESDTRVQQALATAIRYAALHRAAVISMSLGYGAPSLQVRKALQFALDSGAVVVASAGNSGDRAIAHDHGQAPYSFPADYPGVLGVGAVAQDGVTATFSSANLSVEVAAPGVMVPTQGRDGKYWYVNGTSPACALTAGIAALIKSEYPAMPPFLVDDAITGSTVSKPAGGYNDRVGFGTVDAAAALALARRLEAGMAAHSARQPVIGAAAHFGGGAAAVPAAPVRPRSGARLVVYGALAVLFLAGAALAARWAARSRRDLPGAGPGAARGARADPGERAAAGLGSPGPAWAAAGDPAGLSGRPGGAAGLGGWPGGTAGIGIAGAGIAGAGTGGIGAGGIGAGEAGIAGAGTTGAGPGGAGTGHPPWLAAPPGPGAGGGPELGAGSSPEPDTLPGGRWPQNWPPEPWPPEPWPPEPWPPDHGGQRSPGPAPRR